MADSSEGAVPRLRVAQPRWRISNFSMGQRPTREVMKARQRLWTIRHPLFPSFLLDNAAAQTDIVLIEDDVLARCHRTLWDIELDFA